MSPSLLLANAALLLALMTVIALDIVGLVVFAAGFAIESIADTQLSSQMARRARRPRPRPK